LIFGDNGRTSRTFVEGVE